MKKILAILLAVTLLLTLSVGVPITSANAEETVSTEAYEETEAPSAEVQSETPDAEAQTDEPSVLPATEGPTDETVEEEEDQQLLQPTDESRNEDQPQPDTANESVDNSKSGESDPPSTDMFKTEKPKYVKGEAVVLLEDDSALEKLKKEVTVKETITLEGADGKLNFAVVTEKGSTTQDLIEDLSDEEGVESVVPNMISSAAAITNDPYSKYQWALNNTGQNSGTKGVDVNPETAWKKAASTKKQCVVAVIDSGIDTTHKDLKGVLWKNPTSKLGKKGSCGYDFTGTYSDHSPKDDHGHGTHVAGIIAASGNNSQGISGINKSGIKIMALKVLKSDNYGTWSDELRAFQYVVKAKKLGVNVKAINFSIIGLADVATRNQFDKVFNTLGSLGIVTCVCAGNYGKDIAYKNEGLYYVPASCKSAYCLTVAATDENGSISGYSNYGNKYVDIAAPGDNVLSTVCYNSFQPSIYTPTAISTLCSYYQGFDQNGTGSFGLDRRRASGAYFNNTETYSYTSDEFCGTGGSSMKVRCTGASGVYRWYAFELPYTLSSYTESYTVSARIKCYDKKVYVGMYDIPANYNYNDGPTAWYYSSGHRTWDELKMTIDPYSDSNYRFGTSRRLGFFIYIEEGSATTVYFDHIAVSKQGVSTSKYGKLEYMSGTSMATPYVAGAVALVANAYPSLSASDIIKALKNSATKSSKLKKYVYQGRLLNLKNIAKYAKASYPRATPKISKVTNTASGVKISIGKVKGAVRYRVFYKSGTKWRILGDTLTTTYYHKKAKSGKKYTYTVRCVTKNGKKYQSDYNRTGKSITYVAVPKPTLRNIAAGVRITFKKVSGAAKYRIFRKAGNGKWVKLCDTAKTTVIDRSVKRGGVYRYKIRCLNSKGKYVSAVGYASLIWRIR